MTLMTKAASKPSAQTLLDGQVFYKELATFCLNLFLGCNHEMYCWHSFENKFPIFVDVKVILGTIVKKLTKFDRQTGLPLQMPWVYTLLDMMGLLSISWDDWLLWRIDG